MLTSAHQAHIMTVSQSVKSASVWNLHPPTMSTRPLLNQLPFSEIVFKKGQNLPIGGNGGGKNKKWSHSNQKKNLCF